MSGSLRGPTAALVSVLVAFAATALSWPLLQPTPMALFYAALLASAWYGGVSGGSLAVLLSAAVGHYAFLPPYGAFGTDPTQLLTLAVFVLVASALVGLLTAQRRAASREREGRRWLTATLSSVGDAVIATDSEGRVTFMNEVAERLTGWTARDAAGRDLREVFSIFNEGTRERTESPVKRALETGRIVGLANHTILISKDGTETPIEDSAAPIKDDEGAVRGVILVFRDATERRRAELAQEAVHVSERRFRALVNASSDVVYCMSPDWSEMQPLDGRGLVPSTDAPLRDWMQRNVPPFEQPRVLDAIRGAVAGKRPFEMEHQVLRPDGTLGWTFSRAVPILDPGGDIAEWFGTATDVTRRKEAEEATREQAERLREADRRKDEFLAMLAHELRNPLSAIGNAVTLTSKSGLQEHIDWSMEVITRQMKHLTHLIDDLLDVSRINRGKIELRRRVLDLTPTLAGAVEAVRPLVEERKHTLEVAMDGGDLWADADPTRLEQVVVNLLSNAAKYSENGGHIQLSAKNVGGEVVISVRDRGVGMRPEKLPQMFELFAQGDRSLARSEGGLGIGLTVVKKLVELHGGSVEARSEGPGTGSEFTVRLPGADRPAPAAKPVSAAAAGKRSSRILIVEDNVDTARGMARLLKLLGHEVAVAHDGPEGLARAREHRPEVVLLDIGLPGMDGYEVASHLRREEWCEGTLIIAVSGYGQDEDRRRSKAAGFDHHLLKPLDHDALISLLAAGGTVHT